MADTYTYIVPADPWHVPTQDRLEAARDYLLTLHNDVEVPENSFAPMVYGLGRRVRLTAVCPNCRAVHEERGEVPWLEGAVVDIYDRQGKPTDFDATVPCCGANVSLTAFEFPYFLAEKDRRWLGYQVLAFASACVCLTNCDEPLDAGQRAKLAQLMDCPIRFVVCKF